MAPPETHHSQAETVESVEADPEFSGDYDDNDSALGSEAESSRSESITSSITGYRYLNGRRYHAYREGSYVLPNDETEQSRLDLLHHVFRLALDGDLFTAPLRNDIKRCLDLGTGTGIWAIDFAEEFSSAEVFGTDLSPIQPTWVPPNLKFYVDDMEDEWAYQPEEHFDYIHGRSLSGSVKDWPRLMKQCYENLKPGGYAEFHDYEGWPFSNSDPTLSGCPNLVDWAKLVNEALTRFEKEFDIAPRLRELMVEAGFVDVKAKIIHIPIGPWAKGRKAKQLGLFHREDLLEAVDCFTPSIFTRILGWSVDECTAFVAKVKGDLRNPHLNLYTNFWFVYGRKPEK